MFYIIFSLLGYYVDVEVRTASGRVDMVLRTKTTFVCDGIETGQECG